MHHSFEMKVALLGALLGGSIACSAAADDEQGSSANAGGAGTGNAGGGILTGGQGGLFAVGGGNNTGGGCADIVVTAEKLPLDMYMMLDQSGSMDGGKWDAVTTAIASFVNQPAAAGIGVGINYFPYTGGATCPMTCTTDADCGSCGPCFQVPVFGGLCTGDDSCDVLDYATPDVPIAPLPGVAQAILDSMAAHGPTGGTPTSAALQGAVDYASSWSAANPNHVTIVVLATDGDPTSCDTNLANINAIAASAANQSPPILTFVIGVGQSLTALNGIAAAGGTNQAFLVDTGQDIQQQFLDALNEIQGQALGCTYAIPVPEMGTPDYNQVVVNYTPGGSSTKQTIPKVASQADCPADGNAWYYDNNASPTQILLCDGICSSVSADASGEVQVIIDCASIAF